jgi:hypothetical protein
MSPFRCFHISSEMSTGMPPRHLLLSSLMSLRRSGRSLWQSVLPRLWRPTSAGQGRSYFQSAL